MPEEEVEGGADLEIIPVSAEEYRRRLDKAFEGFEARMAWLDSCGRVSSETLSQRYYGHATGVAFIFLLKVIELIQI